MCKISKEEKNTIAESIMKQKIGAGTLSKNMKAFQEFAQRKREKQNEEENHEQ